VPWDIKRYFDYWRSEEKFVRECETVLAAYDGGDFIDVGSARGWYAILLAPKARPGAVFALFEPNPDAIPRLMRSVGAVKRLFPQIVWIVVEKPVGSGEDVSCSWPLGEDQYPRFVATPTGESRTKSVRLDEFVTANHMNPTFMKIDVEGAELGVLRGAERVLRKHKPTLMIETHETLLPEGQNMAMLWDLLGSCDYEPAPIDARHAIWRPR
jgi:FkbM family methyltransferase